MYIFYTQFGYSYFSTDFRLKIFYYTFLDYKFGVYTECISVSQIRCHQLDGILYLELVFSFVSWFCLIKEEIHLTFQWQNKIHLKTLCYFTGLYFPSTPKPKMLLTKSQPWVYSQHPPGRGVTPLYGLYRYVRPQRVWFFSHFGHK